MKFLVIIQARCGSTRLKNKVLLPLNGKPSLQRVVERVQKSQYIDGIVVATSIDKQNLPIVKLCADLDVNVFVGSENDVLDRYYQAAKLFSPEYVIRITGDCPLIDPKIIDNAIEKLEPETDYLGMLSESFADGLDVEIFRFSALKRAWKEASLMSQREHITQYIIHNPDIFILQDYTSGIEGFGKKRWTVDESEDYEFMQKIYRHFGDNDFSYLDVLEYLKQNPSLEAINSKYARNEGLAISLANDFKINLPEEG